MNNVEKLKKYVNDNNGILLTSDVVKMNIHKQYIKILCDENFIVKLEKGVYAKPNKIVNNFFLLQQRYKKGIFSHNTALYLYNLTDRTPLKIDLTFVNNVRVNDCLIDSHYIKKENFEVGLTKMRLQDGTIIKIYDLERTIIDILRDRNKLDLQIVNTALKEYVKRKDKNLITLAQYAKKFNLEKILKQYMEVLL